MHREGEAVVKWLHDMARESQFGTRGGHSRSSVDPPRPDLSRARLKNTKIGPDGRTIDGWDRLRL